MPTLTAADWLNAWEQSLVLPAALRPCALLAPLLNGGMEVAQELPIGERDADLLEIYAALFGGDLQAVTRCPACGDRQEFGLAVADLRQPARPQSSRQLRWQDAAADIHYRLPNSLDLTAIERAESLAAAEQILLQRCCESLLVEGQPADLKALSSEQIEALLDAMTAADPQAITELRLQCAACEQVWDEPLDIGAYLQESLGFWAEATLNDVHLMASSYGWNEQDILKLTPQRRARYRARILA